MKELIPMTDFILKLSKIGMEVQSINHQNSDRARRFYEVVEYAKFLKRPLTLGMFIPCDEEGRPMEEPKVDTTLCCDATISNGWCPSCDRPSEGRYQKAKEKVLFEGFEIHHYEREDEYSLIDKSGAIAYKSKRTNNTWFFHASNIEGLSFLRSGLKYKEPIK